MRVQGKRSKLKRSASKRRKSGEVGSLQSSPAVKQVEKAEKDADSIG